MELEKQERLETMELFNQKVFSQLLKYCPILIIFLALLFPYQTANAAPKKKLTTSFQTVTSLTVINGSGQNTTVDTNFTQDFRVVAQDGGSNVAGAQVTFTAPAGDPNNTATVIFTSTSSNTITVTTDANGIATVPASMIRASRRSSLGAFYNVDVTAGSANTIIQLQNNPGPPAMITVQAGAGQQVQINTPLPIGLVALLVDGFDNPVPAVSVTFTAPSSGASGRFPGNSLTATVITNAMGLAIAPTFTTNGTVGVYNVTANKTTAPLAQPANFNLVNLGGTPTQITVSQGSGQTTQVTTNFGNLLIALVRDAGNNPVANITVTFTVVNGTGGVTGNFAGQATFTAITDANGLATATVPLTAGQITGSFTVIARFNVNGPTATFTLTVSPGPANIIISQQGNGQQATINFQFGQNLIARVTDQFGNRISGIQVTFVITAGGGGASGVFVTGGGTTRSVNTNGSGDANVGRVRANSMAGSFMVTATAAGVAGQATYMLTNLTPTATNLVVAGGSVSSQSTNVNTTYPIALAVRARDVNNADLAPPSSVMVTFTINAGGNGASGTFAGGLTTVTVTTGSGGVATAPALTANGIVGTFTVTATVNGLTVTFTLSNTAAAMQITTVSGSPQTTIVNTNFGAALVARVTDNMGTPQQGVVVVVTAPTSGPRCTFGGQSSLTLTTDAQGLATTTIPRAGQVSGGFVVNATIIGTATFTTFNLTNNPGAPSNINRVQGNNQSATIGLAFGIALIAQVRDQFNNGVPGINITFTLPAANQSGAFPGPSLTFSGTSDAQGMVTAPTITANLIAGQYNVNAQATGGNNPQTNFSITNNAGAPASISIQAGSNQSTQVNTNFGNTLQAIVRDANNNPVSGATVTFMTPNTGASATFGGAIMENRTTNASGIATSNTIRANTITGTFNAQAAVNGVVNPAIFTLMNTPGPAVSIILISGTPQTTLITTTYQQPLVAQVQDSFGNPVPNAQVRFTAPVAGAAGTFAGGATQFLTTTDSFGNATSTILTANNIPGSYSVSATLVGVGLAVQFNLTNLANPITINITNGSPQTMPILTAFAPLVVRVRDNLNLPVVGAVVTFTAPGNGASGTFPGNQLTTTAITDINGNATAPTFTANNMLGSYMVMASVPTTGQPLTANFSLTNTVGPPNAILATGGGNQMTPILAQFGNPLQATVRDIAGNLLSGISVTFTIPNNAGQPGGTFPGNQTTATALTNANGVATSPIITANVNPGNFTGMANVAGVGNAANYTLTNLNNVPASINISNGNNQQTPVATQFGQTLQITVLNSVGNPIPNTSVTFAVNVGGNGAAGTLANITVQTNANGQASTTITANQIPGNFTVTATAGAITATFNLTNIPGQPASIVLSGNGTQSTQVTTQFGQTLQALVRDQFNNPVPNITVTFTIATANGATGTFPGNQATTTAVTNASGIATSANVTANQVTGTYNVSATAPNVPGQASYTLTNLAGAPTSITANGNTNQTTKVLTQFGQTLQATVNDQFGNLVPNVTVTFTLAVGTNGASGSFPGNQTTAIATTNANGVATSPIVTANGRIGTHNPTAQVAGVGTLANYVLNNIVGDPAGISASGSTDQTTKVLTQFGQILQASVVDAANNPVPNVMVTFTLAVGTNGASGSFPGNQTTATATTDTNGVATSPIVTANGKIGTHNPTAQVAGVGTLANYILNNIVGDPAGISATGSTNQTTKVLTQFGQVLQATVVDAANNPVPNVTVTFSLAVGTNGASGSFPGNQTTATATTDANGVATSPIVTANGKIGTHNPTAQVAGVGTLANYVLNNIVGDPAGITAVGNSNQTTQVLTQFINPLKALVTDLAGNPVPNATVTFVIGTAVNGASGSFTGGVTTIVLTTGPDGTVTTALITANGNLGSYTVTATVNGVATPLTYTLTNLVGNPAGIAVIGTSTQVTNILTPFGNPLQALVTDLAGNPVPNVRVTFTLPTTQPNGTFPGQTSSASVPTNSAGIATSPIITASSQTGTYVATGAADGINQNLTYTLTNISDPAGSILAIGESEQTTVVTTAFVRPLQVLVIDNRGNPVNNVPVTFTMDNSRPNGIFRTGSTTAIVNTGTDGIATSPIVVANSIVGSYGVTATVSGVPTVLRFKLNNICSTITVSPEVLPDAIFGTPYQVVLKVTDSVNGKVSLSIQNQSGLATIPPGMTLDPVTGMLAGNPTQSGVFTFTIVASNEFGCSTTKDFNLAVKDPNCEELPFEPRDLEDGKVGRPYNVALLIGGNAVAPFIFEIANGKLPNGLLMDRTTGLISGLPTIAGNFTFTVVVKAANGCTGTKVYFIRICAVEHKPIFVADVGNNRVQRSDDGGATWTIVGGPGNGLGQFNAPAGIETNAMGTKIFVSDTGNNRIQRSLDSGRTWEIIADFGTKVGQVNSPVGLAYDENNDKLYVADTENSRVQVLDQAGSEKVGVFKIFAGATEGEKVGKMSKPKDVAVTCDGVVYVADTSNNRVQMNATGDRKDWKIFAGATQGRKIGKFRLPTGVFVDTRNVVYVADTANDRVQVNSSASESGWTVMFDNSQALGNVKAPQGVTVTDNGEVFVTDTNNNRLRRRVIDGDNNQITSSGEGQFVNPVGIR